MRGRLLAVLPCQRHLFSYIRPVLTDYRLSRTGFLVGAALIMRVAVMRVGLMGVVVGKILMRVLVNMTHVLILITWVRVPVMFPIMPMAV